MLYDIVIYMPIKLNSKRVKNKSIKEFCNRPLLCWSLEKLDKLNIPIFIYSSSCDIIKNLLDFDIKNILFCDRDKALDGDEVIGIDIYKSFGNIISSKNYILTHCTSPFINVSTYIEAVESLLNKNYDSVFTATEEKTFCWLDGERINFNLPRIQTQFLKPVFVETSGIYGYKKHVLDLGSRTSNDNFNIIKVSKLESIDIDTLDDFYFAEKVGRSIINDGGLL